MDWAGCGKSLQMVANVSKALGSGIHVVYCYLMGSGHVLGMKMVVYPSGT